MKKVLITGGMGFIGSNLIRYLIKKYPDWFIINFDKLTYAGNPENLKDIEKNPHYMFLKEDIAEYKAIESAVSINEPDIVINMAAESHVDRSILGSSKFINTNIVGANNVFEACRKHNVKKIIQIGTDEVYGSMDTGEFATEDFSLNPSSPYSAAKASADLLALSYYKTHKLPIFITRSTNNYGPAQFPEKLIPLFITNLLENKKVPLYGTGDNVRDWLYVEDNCRAIDFLLEKGKPGEIYNIAGKNEITNLEITELILTTFKKTKRMIQYVKDRPGHDFRYAINSAKLQDLGWEPKFTLSHGMDTTFSWYERNKNWWKKIKSGEYKEYYDKQYK